MHPSSAPKRRSDHRGPSPVFALPARSGCLVVVVVVLGVGLRSEFADGLFGLVASCAARCECLVPERETEVRPVACERLAAWC